MNRVKNRRSGNGMRSRRNKKRFSNSKRMDMAKLVNKGSEIAARPPYQHKHEFKDFNLHPELLVRISNHGYKIPSEIQDQAIPEVMTGRDIIGIAGTGTGKTATFLLPIIQGLLENCGDNRALIVAPTRELATQIHDEFKAMTKGLKLFATCLIGGIPVHKSINELRRTNHLIIGTPGRLDDMARRNHLRFDRFQILVLDEFDRMLDMGFVNEVMAIDEKMVNKEQTLLFSATMDKSIQPFIEKICYNPVVIKAGPGTQNTNNIDQDVLRVPKDKNKFEILHNLILEQNSEKVLLFCSTKRKVDQIHKKLNAANVKTDLIHGDKSQRARDVALRKFKNGQINVLVATDVVARGIDVTDVSLVINYEIPQNYNDYVHRVGRTGRAGKMGRAITLID